MKSRQTHGPAIAAAKAGFSTATAYRIEAHPRLPSNKHQSRGRRRPDPLAGAWEGEIVPMLEAVRAVAIFEGMCRRHPDLAAGVAGPRASRRTMAGVQWTSWDVMFRHEHPPGLMGLSDFTDMASLGLTIAHEPLAHRLSPFRALHAHVVPGGENFVALAERLQNALWALGGVPQQNRRAPITA
jgi:hypothetical protein